ncbi:MAG TPA: hypothetical protein PK668_21690 [Myxococcota bacterium]|nr:hypothetical protein [Myxococcota bacterium]HRY96091.1 hypothetical protein [Myxococcota bacterium]
MHRGPRRFLAAGALAALFAIAPPAALAGPGQSKGVTIGPEFQLIPPIPVATPTYMISVATDGTDFVFAWDSPTSLGDPNTSDVLVTRVSSAGEILDPFGIPLSTTGEGSNRNPQIAFGGGVYLVVWERDLSPEPSELFFSRVSPIGELLDQPAVGLGQAAFAPADVAFNGQDFWVVLTDPNLNAALTSINPDGALGQITPLPMAINDHRYMEPRIACLTGECLVVWPDQRAGQTDIYATRISADGQFLDPDGIAIAATENGENHPAIASDGIRYFVGWNDFREPDRRQFYGTYVTPAGEVVFPGGQLLTTTDYDFYNREIEVFGSSFFVFWSEHPTPGGYDSHLMAGRIDQLGSIDCSIEVFSTVGKSMPEVGRFDAASNGQTSFLTWAPQGMAIGISEECELDPDGIFGIPTKAPLQSMPAIGTGFGEYLAVWVEERYRSHYYDFFEVPEEEVYGARFDASGTALDPSGVVLKTANASLYRDPVVASGVSAFLVAWIDGTAHTAFGIRGQLFDPEARPLNSPEIALSHSNSRPAASQNERMKLVSVAASPVELYFLDSSFVLAGSRTYPTDNRWLKCQACDHENCLVFASYPQMIGEFYDAQGTMVNTGVATYIAEGGQCAAAFDGETYLVVTNAGGACRGTRVSTDGHVLDTPMILLFDSPVCDKPSLVFDGSAFVLSFISPNAGGGNDVYVTQVSRELESDSPTLVAQDLPVNYPPPSPLASLGDGRSMLLYPRNMPEMPYRSLRVVGRMIQRAVDGSACQRYDDCRSGACVDGFCCDTACGGGAQDDCVVCSAALGADADGTCTSLSLGTSCGDQTSSVCTAPDTCDAQGQCLPNHASPSTECRPAADPCDAPEFCNAFGNCARDAPANDGTLCDDDDACSLADACVDGECRGGPMDRDGDGFVDVACGGTDCQDLDPAIHPAAFEGPHGSPACADGLDNDCDGATDLADEGCHECEADSDCSDANLCNGAETCLDSSCQPGAALHCDDQETCTLDSCEPTLGCVSTPVEGPCDDGDACTQADRCVSGGCVGEPLECLALDSCHLPGVCEPASGTCTNPPAADGEPCETGTCQAGVCVASQDGGVEEEDAGEDGADGLDQDAADGEDGAQTEDDGTISPEEDAGLPDGEQDGEPDQDAQTDPDDGSTSVGPGCGCGTTAPEGLVTLSLLLLGLAVLRSRTRRASP